MFKKEDKSKSDKTGFSGDIAEQKPFRPIQDNEKKHESTTIGEHIFIEGNIRGSENLVIEGSMKGNIEMDKHDFALGPKGRFEGEIQAQNVTISGQMVGNIKTQGRVEISKEADFSGDIKAKSISVGDGAYFKGTIELDRDPNRKKPLPEKASIVTIPQPAGNPSMPSDKSTKNPV